MMEWFDRLGLWGRRAPDKFIPEEVHGLPDDQVALFLRHLWSTDGSITSSRNGRGPVVRVYYASTSRRLADGVRRLLLRLDVRTRLHTARKDGYKPGWHVTVEGTENVLRFLTVVGCHGERGMKIPACQEALMSVKQNPNVDLVPRAVGKRVREALSVVGLTHRKLASALGERYCGSYLLGSDGRPRRFSRGRLERMGLVCGDAGLVDLATSDVFWDEVVEITPLGEMPTFDATVEGTHNFVANGIVAHNSIEQDADIVMFLYRDDYYNREKSEKPGIAEVIVAKHRNGPTGIVKLSFEKQFLRFQDFVSEGPNMPDFDAGGF